MNLDQIRIELCNLHNMNWEVFFKGFTIVIFLINGLLSVDTLHGHMDHIDNQTTLKTLFFFLLVCLHVYNLTLYIFEPT